MTQPPWSNSSGGPKPIASRGLRPVDQVRALGDERVVALAVEGDEAHEPLVRLAGQLVDARHVGVVELLVAGNLRLGRDDVLRPVMPAAIGRGPPVQRLAIDVPVGPFS